MADARVEALRHSLGAALAMCEREMRRRGEIPRTLGWKIASLRRLLAVGRLPRVVALGRRGAGKSSLVNALLGAPAMPVGDVADRTGEAMWRTVALRGQRIDWLDTPGLRAAARRSSRRDEVYAAVIASPPDLVLALCQAAEVDAGIDDDLDDMSLLLDAMRIASGSLPTVLGVVTKVDELSPPDVAAPFDDGDKQAHIATAMQVFARHLARRSIDVQAVIPAATYICWQGDLPGYDGRWNISAVADAIVQALPDEATLRGERLCQELGQCRRALGAEIVEHWAAMAFAGGTGVHEGELAALEASLVTILSALGAGLEAETGGASPDEILRAARGRGPTDLLRHGLARVGARRAGAWVGATRLRALGKALMRLEDTPIDLETARALVPGVAAR